MKHTRENFKRTEGSCEIDGVKKSIGTIHAIVMSNKECIVKSGIMIQLIFVMKCKELMKIMNEQI